MQRSWGGKELGTFQALSEKQCGWSTAGQKKERHEDIDQQRKGQL